MKRYTKPVLNRFSTSKIWTKTLTDLRFISGVSQESMVEILDRLVSRERTRVERKAGISIQERASTA